MYHQGSATEQLFITYTMYIMYHAISSSLTTIPPLKMPVNVMNTYGCNRPQILDKNIALFPPGTHPGAMFNNSSHSVPPFYSPIDNGLPLPMFHLHSRLSKLQECGKIATVVVDFIVILLLLQIVLHSR